MENHLNDEDVMVDEETKVESWRTEQFEALGFDGADAVSLACMTKVHHSYVRRMLDNGWTHDNCLLVLL